MIPDQAILINAVPLQEARYSSEIENIVTTQDELFRAAGDETSKTDPETKEVLRYRTALREGSEKIAGGKRLSMQMIRDVCSTLRDQKINFRAAKEQVYIGGRGGVTYTPPRGGPRGGVSAPGLA